VNTNLILFGAFRVVSTELTRATPEFDEAGERRASESEMSRVVREYHKGVVPVFFEHFVKVTTSCVLSRSSPTLKLVLNVHGLPAVRARECKAVASSQVSVGKRPPRCNAGTTNGHDKSNDAIRTEAQEKRGKRSVPVHKSRGEMVTHRRRSAGALRSTLAPGYWPSNVGACAANNAWRAVICLPRMRDTWLS